MKKSKNKRREKVDYHRFFKGSKSRQPEKIAESHLVNLEKASNDSRKLYSRRG